MAGSSYNSQILAVQAAASIQGDGTNAVTYGCNIARTGLGTYVLTLPDGDGLVDDQSFTRVQVKGSVGACATVVDTDLLNKTIFVFSAGGTGALDAAIEVVVERATINL